MRHALILILMVFLVSPALAAKKKDWEELPEPPRDEESGRYVYQEVVEAGGLSATALYARAQKWVAKAYVSAQDVVQLDSSDAHSILIKPKLEATAKLLGLPQTYIVDYTLMIEVKDGRWRYTVDQITYSQSSTMYGTSLLGPLGEAQKNRTMERLRRMAAADTHAQVSELIASLKTAMQEAAAEEW